eukprot:320254-Prymnesium_polylepis.1
MILGDEVEIKRAARGAVIKQKGTHVNLEVQQENNAELAVWGARLDPTAVYVSDGTTQVFRNEGGRTVCTQLSE